LDDNKVVSFIILLSYSDTSYPRHIVIGIGVEVTLWSAGNLHPSEARTADSSQASIRQVMELQVITRHLVQLLARQEMLVVINVIQKS